MARVAVGVLALDHRRSKVAFAGVVVRFNSAWEGRECQELVARLAHLVLDVASEVTDGRGRQDVVDRLLQLPPPRHDARGCQRGDVPG